MAACYHKQDIQRQRVKEGVQLARFRELDQGHPQVLAVHGALVCSS